MVDEDREEEIMHEKDLDESQEALESTKQKDKNHMQICYNKFQKTDDDVVMSYSAFYAKFLKKSNNEDSSTWKIKGSCNVY